jgi:DNA polymerase I-like protein with 3'-5' exonuclease and polymerase domains
VIVCHDEVVLECDAGEAEHVATVAAALLRRGMGRFLQQVPVEVEVVVCRDWSGTPVEGTGE